MKLKLCMNNKDEKRYAVICHLFYPDVSEILLKRLGFFSKKNTYFFINVQGETEDHKKLLNRIRQMFPGAFTLTSSNKGRDIGAKLLLLSLQVCLDIISDYTLIIHDKKSPHVDNGDYWRERLYKVIEPGRLSLINKIFTQDDKIGIIGSSDFILNEYDKETKDFNCTSNKHIKHYLKKYEIEISDFSFIAGNIFWIRSSILNTFFSQHNIMEIRSDLETGNVLDFNGGTKIHSWERIMSWIALSQGYKICGI